MLCENVCRKANFNIKMNKLPSELNAIVLNYLACPRFSIKNDNDGWQDRAEMKSSLILETNGIKTKLSLTYRYKRGENMGKHDRLGRFLARVAMGQKAKLDSEYTTFELNYNHDMIKIYLGNVKAMTLTSQVTLIVIDWLKQLHNMVPAGHYFRIE